MPVRPPSLRAVAAFEAAARHQSFAKAGEELNLTQGAISHAIRALEERLGCQLFERRGRGVLLTEPGRMLAGRVRLSLGLLSQAFETRPWLERSRLVVTTVPALAERFLIPRLGRFRAEHPDITLEIRTSATLSTIGDGDIDVGIRYGPGGWPHLSASKLADELLFPVASPAMAAKYGADPEDLPQELLISHFEFPWRPWFDAVGLDRPEPRGMLTLDDSGGVIEAAAAGVGITLGRELLVEPDLQTGRLTRLFNIAVKSNYSYWFVWNATAVKTETIELFRNWLEREFASRNPVEHPTQAP